MTIVNDQTQVGGWVCMHMCKWWMNGKTQAVTHPRSRQTTRHHATPAARQVYMELRGMVDAAAEIRKLEKQLGQVETRATSLQKQMAIPGYEEKVRECGRVYIPFPPRVSTTKRNPHLIVDLVSLCLYIQVPKSVRQGNTVKAEQLTTERDNVLKAIESFKALLIS